MVCVCVGGGEVAMVCVCVGGGVGNGVWEGASRGSNSCLNIFMNSSHEIVAFTSCSVAHV